MKRAAIGFVLLVWLYLWTEQASHGSESERLEALLCITARVLEQHDVTYWAAGGTLFGAYIDRGLPRDDFDADLMVTLGSAARIRAANWTAHGLLCYEGLGGFRIKTARLGALRVDLFVRRVQDGVLRYGWPPMDRMYKKALLPARLVFPLRRLPMDGCMRSMYAPHRPHEALTFEYGAYTRHPPRTWKAMGVGFVERYIWSPLIPLVSLFSPAMPY